MSGTITCGKLVLTDTSYTTLTTDAYDRLRVSNPFTLLDIVPMFDLNPLLIDTLIANGTVAYESANGVVRLNANGFGTGSKIVRQTFTYVSSPPGKSKIAILTGIMSTTNGSTSRIGTFDDSNDKIANDSGNGLFYQVKNGTCSVVSRFNQVDASVPQTSWNVDKMDGHGHSGFIITDWSKLMIYVIDMQWCGIIRFGLFINGVVYYVHTLTGSGLGTPLCAALTLPYIRMPKLPIRYELVSGPTIVANMAQISGSVISEGGYSPTGIQMSYCMPNNVSISTSETPLLSIALQKTDPENRVSIVTAFSTITSNRSVIWTLYVVPNAFCLFPNGGDTPGYTSFANASMSYSHVTWATGNGVGWSSSKADWALISSGFTDSTSSTVTTVPEVNLNLDTGIVGYPRVLTLTIANLGTSSGTAQAAFTWNENKW